MLDPIVGMSDVMPRVRTDSVLGPQSVPLLKWPMRAVSVRGTPRCNAYGART